MERELKLISDQLDLIGELEVASVEGRERFVESYTEMIGYFRALGESVKAFLPESPEAISLKEAIVSGFNKDLQNLCITGIRLVLRFEEAEAEARSKAVGLLEAYQKAIDSLRSYEDSYSINH